MRYFIELSYNGKQYHGWQMQPNASSVQQVLNDALSMLLKESISVVGAGRTDAGVHAAQMFAHFDTTKEVDTQELVKRINAFISQDIAVHSLHVVNAEAHARFDAVRRSYEYRIWLGRSPFLIDTTWQLYSQHLDLAVMNKAALILKDYTDFKCFSKSKTDVKTYHCTIKEAVWIQDGQLLIFKITADRFLRNMVRAIVGTLIDIGLGKLTIDDFRKIIESRDRTKAGFSVPAQGLFLTEVVYPESILKNRIKNG